MKKTLDQKIEEVGGECIGVFTALLAARKVLGDNIVSQFLDKVEEKNSALWDRFKEYRKTVPESFGFHHFILSVVKPPMPV
ncbi:MAG: hypothetical protein Q7R78_00995 [bacterium]|nr:hypothetical protein [bacterium]